MLLLLEPLFLGMYYTDPLSDSGPSPVRTTFVVFLILNLFLWRAGSSAVIPFTTILILLCLWFGVFLPLTFLGAFLAFRKPVCEQLVPFNMIPREISFWKFTSPILSSLLGGILPFGCVFIQVFFIHNSIW